MSQHVEVIPIFSAIVRQPALVEQPRPDLAMNVRLLIRESTPVRPLGTPFIPANVPEYFIVTSGQVLNSNVTYVSETNSFYI